MKSVMGGTVLAGALAVALAVAGPASAATDVNLKDIATIFCAGLITDDMSVAKRVLSDDLAAAVTEATPKMAVPWTGGQPKPDDCFHAGNSGTAERPESTIALLYGDGSSRAEVLIVTFVGDNLRIDDIRFPDGTTLREKLDAKSPD